MSRIGLKPITIDKEVQVNLSGKMITIIGPKGSLSVPLAENIEFKIEESKVFLTRTREDLKTKALHGLTRSLLYNAVMGVVNGYQKKLELVGTGYRVKLEGSDLHLSLGFSHPVIFKAVSGIEFIVEGNNVIYVKGIDKHLVGQTAADIRTLRPPEPYKGKGIRYSDEIVRRKAGKTVKSGEK